VVFHVISSSIFPGPWCNPPGNVAEHGRQAARTIAWSWGESERRRMTRLQPESRDGRFRPVAVGEQNELLSPQKFFQFLSPAAHALSRCRKQRLSQISRISAKYSSIGGWDGRVTGCSFAFHGSNPLTLGIGPADSCGS
jgi:hypothetical protein